MHSGDFATHCEAWFSRKQDLHHRTSRVNHRQRFCQGLHGTRTVRGRGPPDFLLSTSGEPQVLLPVFQLHVSKFFASELPDWQCGSRRSESRSPTVAVAKSGQGSASRPGTRLARFLRVGRVAHHEVYFAMLDDRVVPVGNVKCSIRPHRSIDGTERYPLSGDNLRLLATDVTASVGLRCEAADAMAAEVIGHKVTDPFGGTCVPESTQVRSALGCPG